MRVKRNDIGGLLNSPPPTPEMRQMSGREIAAQNELAVLMAIRDYGHLRTAEIASAVWPTARYPEQLAQRTLRRLLAKGEVLQRVNAIASVSWVLASAGVTRLELFGGNATHGRDIVGVAGATFVHRTLASAFLIRQSSVNGSFAIGEYGIAHGRAPATRQVLSKRFGKLPDGLVLRGNAVDWVEVEASAKPLNDLKAVLKAAEWVGLPLVPEQPYRLSRLFIVFDKRQGHARRILKAARELWGHLPRSEQQRLRERIVLAQAEVSSPLKICGFSETRLSDYQA